MNSSIMTEKMHTQKHMSWVKSWYCMSCEFHFLFDEIDLLLMIWYDEESRLLWAAHVRDIDKISETLLAHNR